MRILSVQPVSERGGSDRALIRMIERLPEDFDVHVAVPGPHPLAGDFSAAGATLHVLPMRRVTTHGTALRWVAYLIAWPLAVGRLARLIRRNRVDLVHSNSLHSWYGWAAAFVTRRPHVWHARETVTQSGAALALERFLARRFAARVFACSRAVAEQLRGAAVDVCLELDAGGFSPDRAGEFRRRAGIDDDAPLVGVVGRIWPGKGLDVALDAFRHASEAVPRARLVVVGEAVTGHDAYARDVEAACAAAEGAQWLGPAEDVASVVADLDLLAVPSTHPEPFGLAAVEALASGVPIVVTDAGGAPEIAAAAGRGAADVVPPGDAAGLARAMTDRLGGLRTSTALRRRRTPLLEPSWPDYAGLFLAASQPTAGRDAGAGRLRRRRPRNRR